MNIFLRELTVNKKSMIIWSMTLSALGILVMSVFPTIAKEGEALQKLLESFPPGLLAAFGMDKISMTDILGFYTTKQYTTVTLLGSIYAVMLAAGLLSKEESEKTIEFLLAKPINRSEIVTGKLLSLLTLLILFNFIVSVVMYITLLFVKLDNFSFKLFFLLCIAGLILHLTFAALGFLLSVFITKSKNILPLSLGIVFVTYFLGIASSLTKSLDFLKYISPFKYVDPTDIITSGKLSTNYLLVMFLIIIFSIALTYFFYNRKDIYF